MRKSSLLVLAVVLLCAAMLYKKSHSDLAENSAQDFSALTEEKNLHKESAKTNSEAASKTATERAPAAAPSMAVGATDVDKAKNKLDMLAACLQSQSCNYPQTDPHSYAFAVNHDWQEVLKSLAAYTASHPEEHEKITALARESMLNPDGHVQEAALDLFAKMPTDPKNLNVILTGLSDNSADPLIFQQASAELQRYSGGSEDAKVQGFLEQSLVSGAQYVSEQAAIVARNFITAKNVENYRQILKSLPDGSAKARNLRSSLDDYEQHLSGG